MGGSQWGDGGVEGGEGGVEGGEGGVGGGEGDNVGSNTGYVVRGVEGFERIVVSRVGVLLVELSSFLVVKIVVLNKVWW